MGMKSGKRQAGVGGGIKETGIKTIPMEKKCKKAQWLPGEALQIAVKEEKHKKKDISIWMQSSKE